MRLYARNDPCGFAMCRDEVIPTTGRNSRWIEPQNAIREGITTAKVVEQPAVYPLLLQGLLNLTQMLRLHGFLLFTLRLYWRGVRYYRLEVENERRHSSQVRKMRGYLRLWQYF